MIDRMSVVTLAFAAVSLVAPKTAPAESTGSGRHDSPPLIHETTRHLGIKLGALGSRETLAWTAAGASLTALTHQVENPDAQAAFLEEHGDENLFRAGNVYGNGIIPGAATVAAWLIGRAAGIPSLEETAIDLGTSLVITGAVVAALKFSVDRTRPNGASYSFPSGHSATAFTVAPVLQRRYGFRAGIPAYAMAFITATARMEDKKHYLSDVVAGAAIGMLAGRLPPPGEDERRLALFLDGEGAGVKMSF